MNEPKFYLVQGVGPGLDGLVVQGAPALNVPGFIDVSRLVDRDTVVGDRHPSLQLEVGTLLISEKNISETEDPTLRQYASNNPHGQFQLEGTVKCGSIEVAYAQYERALAVTVMSTVDTRDKPAFAGSEHKQTVYSENFLYDFDSVKKAIEADTEKGDLSELIFVLKSIKELEAAAQKVKRGETE